MPVVDANTVYAVCHIPPVTEAELFKRMKADDDGQTSGGIAAWTCKRCSKKANDNVVPTSTMRKDQGERQISSGSPQYFDMRFEF